MLVFIFWLILHLQIAIHVSRTHLLVYKNYINVISHIFFFIFLNSQGDEYKCTKTTRVFLFVCMLIICAQHARCSVTTNKQTQTNCIRKIFFRHILQITMESFLWLCMWCTLISKNFLLIWKKSLLVDAPPPSAVFHIEHVY